MSTTSSISSLPEVKKAGDSRPIKLRSACNSCFAAKVRCDGNKEGCKRCTEKRLECTYSESMVGKVVGKRRKRPMPDSKAHLPKATQWNVTVGPAALPSPALSVVSEHQNKRPCVSNDWTNMIAYDEQPTLDFSQCDEQQFLNLELTDDTELDTTKDTIPMMYGLPTPSISPPAMQFLSPADLEIRSQSSPPSVPASEQIPQAAYHPSMPLPFQPQPEDDETICLKLLAHVKRLSTQDHETFASTLALINKTNAALRRLLQSRRIRTDYTCQLLLTNITLHLAEFCERLLDVPDSAKPEEFTHEVYLTESDKLAYPEQRRSRSQTPVSKSIAKHSVHEATMLCSAIGDLLKRKPLNGFQILGRQESAHVEIDVRLRHVLASLS